MAAGAVFHRAAFAGKQAVRQPGFRQSGAGRNNSRLVNPRLRGVCRAQAVVSMFLKPTTGRSASGKLKPAVPRRPTFRTGHQFVRRLFIIEGQVAINASLVEIPNSCSGVAASMVDL